MPSGPLYSIADIFEDPQYAHRETDRHEGVADRPAGRARHRARRSRTRRARSAGSAPRSAPHTDEVLAELLHRTPDEIAKLRADGVI